MQGFALLDGGAVWLTLEALFGMYYYIISALF